MLTPRELGKLAVWLSGADHILLVTHEFPDGDGVGSVLALRAALVTLGKTVTCLAKTTIPTAFSFLPKSELFQTDFLRGDYDLVIALDCGDLRRTGFDSRLRHFSRTARRLVNIDHHPRNDLGRLANLNLSDPAASATAQLIYQLYQEFGWSFNHDVATSLLTGLHTDTGGFKHPNTTPEVLSIAAALLGHGARLQDIIRGIHQLRTVATLRLWGIVLDRLKDNHELGIVSSMVTLADLHHCAADHTDVAGVVNLIKTIPNTKAAILFTEQPDGSIKASIRASAAGVDAARLAGLFGGGGLKKAGGFSIPARMCHQAGAWQIVWQQ